MVPVYWLRRRQGLDRQLRWLEGLAFLLVALMMLGALAAIAWVQSRFGGQQAAGVGEAVRLLTLLLLIGGAAAPLLLAMVLPFTRAMRVGLGLDGERVLLRLADGRTLALAASEVRQGRYCLYCRQYTLPLRDRRGRSFYVEGEIEERLEPRLHAASAITRWQELRHQWTFRDRMLLWPMASVAVLAVLLALVLALVSVHPGVFAG